MRLGRQYDHGVMTASNKVPFDGFDPNEDLLELVTDTIETLSPEVRGRFLRDFLKNLVNVEVPPAEGHQHWREILRRRNRYAEEQGRLRPLRETAARYFLDISYLQCPVLIEYRDLKYLREQNLAAQKIIAGQESGSDSNVPVTSTVREPLPALRAAASAPQPAPSDGHGLFAGNQKRTYQRISLETTDAYAVLKSPTGTKTVRLLDVSFGGISFLLEEKTALPEILEAQLRIPLLPLPTSDLELHPVYRIPFAEGLHRVGCSFVARAGR